MYRWTVVEESLLDNRLLNDLDILSMRISEDEDIEDRWHIYDVYISYEDIMTLSKMIKTWWYMHFWMDNKVLAVFKWKVFEFEHDNKDTWHDAISYGLSIGIPEHQLDFVIY